MEAGVPAVCERGEHLAVLNGVRQTAHRACAALFYRQTGDGDGVHCALANDDKSESSRGLTTINSHLSNLQDYPRLPRRGGQDRQAGYEGRRCQEVDLAIDVAWLAQ